MREPNLCSPSQNRASLSITSALYDRRALDCTATLPLINSLTHLAYLTSTSPRIREILSRDGGLEQLVRILSTQQQPSDLRGLWKWSIAFQCVVNVGVRGTAQIRTRVVEAGVVAVVLRILQNFLRALEVVSHEKNDGSRSSRLQRHTFPYVRISEEQRRHKRKQRQIFAPASSTSVNIDNVFYREEDILMSLQLLAYLSKYPHIRDLFHFGYDANIFSVVEKFTFPIHPTPIQHWAGVVMRNACRKDETRGGIRSCVNMHCRRREQKPREFAKCRRCRKAKYCSKQCQSRAWNDGHRWWCIERQPPSSAVMVAPTNTANGTTPNITSATTSTGQQQQASSPATESLLSMH
ncbi:hypothetical protein BX666DRAFT_1857831 [Dichotomocladium elegans]|nr:hypothetical protein BX666DRAFT_1857831 [Dichotomocladium elegans]